jgi:hypothetical protein
MHSFSCSNTQVFQVAQTLLLDIIKSELGRNYSDLQAWIKVRLHWILQLVLTARRFAYSMNVESCHSFSRFFESIPIFDHICHSVGRPS